MKNLDHNGLLLCEYQAKIFEKSVDLPYSSPIFIRRFRYSNLLRTLDKNESYLLSLDVNEGIDDINKQFGNSKYGHTKFSKDVMFWMGYMYRYISYTRENRTSFIMKLFSYKLLAEVYFAFHTQDPEWCIKSLLDIIGKDESIFDVNARLKKIIIEKNKS